MSKYGLRIKNFEAGSIYGYNIGIRSVLDSTDAMLTNSLFSDYLKENGLNIWKDKSTRDVICIEFNYGTRSYKEEKKYYEKLKKEINNDEYLTQQVKDKKISSIEFLEQQADENETKFVKKSAQDIRKLFYTEGVSIDYHTYNKKGVIIKTETIKYRMLYRTPGKAKKGSCMFINESIYNKAREFLYMGIKLPEHNAPIIEIGAYSSLITSTIVGKVQIKPEEILILQDVDAYFKRDIISVETDANKHCIAKPIKDYQLKNTLFDGQALIDTSIFPEWGDGYILLRHHMTKMAAFHSNIQLFFQDYFGDQYDTAKVKDMWGNEHYAKNIKLITTDNAIKWLKFDVSFEYWSEWVRKNDCMFGIVKTAHKSKLGEVQRMSYQMVNSLSMDIMPNVVKNSLDYVNKLKTNDDEFLSYLKDNENFSNDYEVLVALVEQNRDFLRSEYFRDRKEGIIKSYVLNLKNGHTVQNADNLVIVGSPYAMLLYAAGSDPLKDDTFKVERDTIQCHTARFRDGEYLAEFRSPFNSCNNLGYLHNVYNNAFQKYFNFGEQIIAVNMIGTDFQDRNNGSDMDSDSIYTTNQEDIVKHAKKCYLSFPTIVNNIPKEKNSYDNTLENYAIIDNNLADAQKAIGESSNLAQVCLTYTYNYEDKKFVEYVCILAVLAQVAIDNAKRKFDIDLVKEISKIKKDMDLENNKLPVFWKVIKKDIYKEKNMKKRKTKKENLDKKINHELICPMNYLYSIKINKYRNTESTLPMSYFFVKHEMQEHVRKSKKVEELIEKYSLNLYEHNTSVDDEDKEEYLLLRSDYDKLIQDIKAIYISNNYLGLVSWLINRAFCIGSGVKSKKNIMESTINTNKSILLKVLYDINSDALLKCFSGNINKKVVND